MADNNTALGLAVLALGGSSGGGEPAAYIKNASVSGNELTLTKKDDTTVVYEPTVDLSAYRTSAAQDVIDAGKQATLTAGDNITIANNVISAAGGDLVITGNNIDENMNFTVDKTPADVQAAITNNKNILLKLDIGDSQLLFTNLFLLDSSTYNLYLNSVNSESSELYSTTLTNNNGVYTGTLSASGLQPTLTAGSGITIEDNVISATGGGAEGAVKYNEAQSLTNTQFNQVMSNLKLGASMQNTNKIIFPESTGLITYYSSSATISGILNRSNLINGNTYIFSATIDGETLTYEFVYNGNTTISFSPFMEFECGYTLKGIGLSSLTSLWVSPYSTTSSSDYNITVSIKSKLTYDVVTNTIRSDLLPSVPILEGTSGTIYSNNCVTSKAGTSNSICIGFQNNNENKAGVINVGTNNATYGNSTVLYGSGNHDNGNNGNILIGNDNTVASSTTNVYLFGKSNANIKPDSSSAKYTSANDVCIFGASITDPRFRFSTTIGQYNEQNYGSLWYIEDFQSSKSYSTGDLMWQGWFVWESKVDSNVGNNPGWAQTDTNYWRIRRDLTPSIQFGTGTSVEKKTSVMIMRDGSIKSLGNVTATNIPAPPASDGNYVLKCAIVSGVATYSWEAQA